MSELSKARAAHLAAIENGTAREEAAARKIAAAIYKNASEEDRDEVFPNRLR